ncbi:MAG: long-chain fatty acid--CoA ligase [Acidobacteria bacterium ACB1]|nr:Long-chain-fatty-acid--CoA ligase FadD15 [Pyrinomonadaceae bacterium]MCE7961205.1 long-chain fatty acid--CoA ligase [Acidobacteria bacterium ACB1]
MAGSSHSYRIDKAVSALRGEPLFAGEPATLPALFIYAAERFDRSDALNYKRGGNWQHMSSFEVVRRAESIALGLHSLGVIKGDRVAIFAPNSPEWTLTDAGCQFAGVIDVPIYTTLSSGQVKYILQDSASKVLFVDSPAAFERVSEAVGECSSIEHIVFLDAAGDLPKNSIRLSDLEDRGAEFREREPDLIATLANAVEPEDIATLIYTSGTTGEPKGVMLSHRNLVSNAIDASKQLAFSPNDTCLSVLPLSHVFERTGMYLYFVNGMAVHYAESVEKVPDNLKEVRPTIFMGVPRIFEKVFEKARLKAARSSAVKERIFDFAIEAAKEYASAKETGQPSAAVRARHLVAEKLVLRKFREFFGGRLRYCITGGAAIADEIYLIFTGADIAIMQGYGMTEASPVITANSPEFKRIGTVGGPIRNVKVRIAEDGEIEVNSPGLMKGYYNKPEATAEAFTADGWLRTGDIGHIDDDGFLSITDRKKELFKTSGGKYIAPSPIEQMIRSSRFVNQVVLVGNERKFPAALIVPNFEMLASYAELKGLDLKTPAEFCRNEKIIDLLERQVAAATQTLSHYEKVKKIALLENELTVENGELTPTLKVKRRVVDEIYRSTIDALYKE